MGEGYQPPGLARRRDFSRAQLTLIRRTIARACTDVEFDHFVEVAQASGLDPLRRQIAPLIMHAADPDRRHLVPLATIDGLRLIAARSGDYRPMESIPVIERDDTLQDADRNPLGIARAEVRAWKFRDGIWFPVIGEAWWSEYAPLRENNNGAFTLEASWARMPRVMIVKCAEAQALRRGWPDLLSGLYGEEEMHAVRRAEETASEALRRLEQGVRTSGTGAQSLWVIFDPAAGLEAVDVSRIAERITSFYESAESKKAICDFQHRNQQSLKIFWDWRPDEALRLKQAAESKLAALAGRRRRGGQGAIGRRKRRSVVTSEPASISSSMVAIPPNLAVAAESGPDGANSQIAPVRTRSHLGKAPAARSGALPEGVAKSSTKSSRGGGSARDQGQAS